VKHLALSRLAELIIDAYPDPDPTDTLEELQRFCNEDLGRLSLEDIDRERLVARLRWAVDPDSSAWLRARLAALDREAAKRRRS
jgi:hypothetical protein